MEPLALLTSLGTAALLAAAPAATPPVRAAKITILSTMLADRGIGEWGFSALVEADGRRLLFDTGADDATLDWTAAQFRRLGVRELVGAHCTGIEAVYRLRSQAGLDRRTAAVGGVGASRELGKGIDPGRLAR
jgi:metal-dependent hydrolase (beta-lactamase superfamily II)